MKPPENESCYGCHHCHSVLDGRIPWILDPPEDFDFWKTVAFAIAKTQRVMRSKGLLIFKGEEAA